MSYTVFSLRKVIPGQTDRNITLIQKLPLILCICSFITCLIGAFANLQGTVTCYCISNYKIVRTLTTKYNEQNYCDPQSPAFLKDSNINSYYNLDYGYCKINYPVLGWLFGATFTPLLYLFQMIFMSISAGQIWNYCESVVKGIIPLEQPIVLNPTAPVPEADVWINEKGISKSFVENSYESRSNEVSPSGTLPPYKPS